jgi:hypothetical protein
MLPVTVAHHVKILTISFLIVINIQVFVITDQDYVPLSTHRPVTTKNTGKYDSIGDKKEKKHVYT